jgi:hypothetical protein
VIFLFCYFRTGPFKKNHPKIGWFKIYDFKFDFKFGQLVPSVLVRVVNPFSPKPLAQLNVNLLPFTTTFVNEYVKPY